MKRFCDKFCDFLILLLILANVILIYAFIAQLK